MQIFLIVAILSVTSSVADAAKLLNCTVEQSSTTEEKSTQKTIGQFAVRFDDQSKTVTTTDWGNCKISPNTNEFSLEFICFGGFSDMSKSYFIDRVNGSFTSTTLMKRSRNSISFFGKCQNAKPIF